ncbi:MAG: ATP-binding protein [Mobiluncus sp.]|uniref:ATP-binding protein n=1 Tax=Mobiluncus sp. TaxID=47293 RepID=UPI00258ACDD3|nr:ATP-binding protein [Mobiluncus sp.]MCI6583723.1 ATP-binding protein [Mobiluncus sp.]
MESNVREPREFKFEFSLSVLDQLGRKLYRNFITILGEAVSNSWDADARNVWIELDRDRRQLRIRDDGIGMTESDMQDKFLKIGYTKRRGGATRTASNRPFIGAKGIGKLALLSCADRVQIISKVKGNDSVGCEIDNLIIDEAMSNDLSTDQLSLNLPSPAGITALDAYASGTFLIFDQLRVSNSTDEYLRKALALYFRFSFIDPTFTIHYNGIPISEKDLKSLADSTEFVWQIGTEEDQDSFLQTIDSKFSTKLSGVFPNGVHGFIASTKAPKDLLIFGSGNRVGIDLFVNGRLRERNFVEDRFSARIASQYLYGQIHFDAIDTDTTEDLFTTSREGVIRDNPEVEALINSLRKASVQIFDNWDEWRLKLRESGDEENKRLSRTQRATRTIVDEQAKSLFQDDYEKILKHLNVAQKEGLESNLANYSIIYTLENLLRSLIDEFDVHLDNKFQNIANGWRQSSDRLQVEAGVPVNCRLNDSDLYYLQLKDLIEIASSISQSLPISLDNRINSLKYLRNIIMHCAQLTEYGSNLLRDQSEAASAEVRLLVNDLYHSA